MEPLQSNKLSHDGHTRCSVIHQRQGPLDLPECAAAHMGSERRARQQWRGLLSRLRHHDAERRFRQRLTIIRFRCLGRPRSWRDGQCLRSALTVHEFFLGKDRDSWLSPRLQATVAQPKFPADSSCRRDCSWSSSRLHLSAVAIARTVILRRSGRRSGQDWAGARETSNQARADRRR